MGLKRDFKKQGRLNRASGARFEMHMKDTSKYSEANKKRWADSEYKKRVGKKISESMIGNKNSFGAKRSEITKEKIRNSEYHKNLKGTKKGTKNPMYGKRGKNNPNYGRESPFKNKKHTQITKQKQRISAINYIKEYSKGISPRLSTNERQILDKLSKMIGYEIIRQYFVKGYFVDGFCKEKNIVFEIDENPKISEREIRREKEIKQELNCKFIRILTYSND